MELRIKLIGMVICLLLGPVNAFAACVQADLKGVWYVTTLLFSTAGSDAFMVQTHCKVIVGGTGAVNPKSKCVDPYGVVFAIDGGQLDLRRTCQVTGRIPWTLNDLTDEFLFHKAYIDKGKSTFTATGVTESGFDLVFNGVKK